VTERKARSKREGGGRGEGGGGGGENSITLAVVMRPVVKWMLVWFSQVKILLFVRGATAVTLNCRVSDGHILSKIKE